MTQAAQLASYGSNNVGLSFKNRIINGAMMIDQRNAGASVTPTDGQFIVDRFSAGLTQASKFTAQQNAGGVTAPAGFKNYLGATSSSAYSVVSGDIFQIRQRIEGFNIADLNWGTANAKQATLSFWVRSSLTGTFGGALRGATSSYPIAYTISSANTWEYKTVTISAPTSGTFNTDNSSGIEVGFSLGCGSTFTNTAGAWVSGDYRNSTGATSVVGTNGATFYITGVQLEKGSVATSFDYRPYGTELALCQRYFTKTYQQAYAPGSTGGAQLGSIWAVQPATNNYPWIGTWNYPVTMRATPTVTLYRPSDGVVNGFNGDSGNYTGATITASGERSVSVFGNNVSISTTMFMSVHAAASAEL